ncbi:MAG: hypothetical protein NHB14_19920 [Desulfosporosinus sp.]|nr:hypothetical protein [Desulfosporosinus sp.]
MTISGKKHVFQRFDLHLRIQHIGMFTSFIVLTITGLPIKFEQNVVSQWIVSIFGGFDNLFAVHLFAGAVMLVDFVYHLLYLVIYPIVTKRLSLAIFQRARTFSM